MYTVSIHGKRLNTFLCFFHVNFPIKLHPRDFRCHKYSLLKLSSRLWISNICEYILNKSHHTEYKGTFTYQTEFQQTTCIVHNVQPNPSRPCQQLETFCVTSVKMWYDIEERNPPTSDVLVVQMEILLLLVVLYFINSKYFYRVGQQSEKCNFINSYQDNDVSQNIAQSHESK